MNEYFEELYSLLGQLSEEERADAVSYYKEFAMDMGIESRELLESSFGPAAVLAEKILKSEDSDDGSVVVKEPAGNIAKEAEPAQAECTALAETVPQKEDELEEITAVQINVTAVDVHIASGEDFSVEYDLPKGEEIAFCGVRNGCLVFETKKAIIDRKGNWTIRGSGEMTLYVPEKKLTNFQVVASSGDVEIDLDSQLETDRIEVKTFSGDITVSDVLANRGIFSSLSGSVEIDGAFADVTASSTSGDISLEANDVGACRLESKSGDVELTGGRLNEAQVTTISGDCTVDVTSCAQCNAKSVSGDCDVNGDMNQAEITSVSGDIEVYGRVGKFWKLKTVSGDISFSAKNKVKIEMSGRRGFRRSFTQQEQEDLPVVRIETVSGEVNI